MKTEIAIASGVGIVIGLIMGGVVYLLTKSETAAAITAVSSSTVASAVCSHVRR